MAKQNFSLNLTCVNKNTNLQGGNVQFALDPKPNPVAGTQPGQQMLTRKVINFQTSDVADLDGFDPKGSYKITIEKV